MKYLVTGKEMKLLDDNTSSHFHVPSMVLMEQAAMNFVRELIAYYKLNENNRILVCCGTGNNGADGIAIARLLNQKAIRTDVYLAGDAKSGSDNYKLQKKIYDSYAYGQVDELTEGYDYIIDGLFGTGLSRSISGSYLELIEQMNSLQGTKIAIDMPSGICADDGAVLGAAFKADATITFSFAKAGQILWPGNEYTGQLIVTEIGITAESYLDRKPRLFAYEEEDVKELPQRAAHSNKGTYGKLLVIAGSKDMSGAAILCARAAYRGGTGLVKLYTAEENRTVVQSSLPEAIVSCYSKPYNEQQLIDNLKWADAVVLGPGIGTDSTAKKIVDCVLKNVTVPMVIDADALNIIAEKTDILLRPHMDIIVTPHLGEMARMTGDSVSFIQSKLIDSATDFANKYNVICVLKDFRTITALPYSSVYINLSGNPGMATAGSGDVLSGIIGGLLAQGVVSEKAAGLGVYIHGLAGDEAMRKKGSYSMMADDIIDGLSYVMCTISG